jgi:hypothetical protein
MTTISLWDPDRIWVSCKNCGQWSEAPVSSGGRTEACSSCRRPIEIPTTIQLSALYSAADEAAIERNVRDVSGRFFFLCPNCSRRFSFPNGAEGDFINCSQCGCIMVARRVTSIPEPNCPKEEPVSAGGPSVTSEQRCDVVLDRSNQEELRKKGSGQEKCCYCETPFDETESDYFCPGCFLRYHEQCWIDNRGCAANGCEFQPPKGPIVIPGPPRGPDRGESHTPWEYALLLGTVILGIVSFATTLWLNIIGAVLSFMVLKSEGLRKGRAAVVKACMVVAIISFLFSAGLRSN